MAGLNTSANERTQRPLPPPGQTLGLLYQFIDLGTQNEAFKGEPKRLQKVYLSFELPKHRAVFSTEKGEQVMVVGQEYTFSLGDKANFRKMMDNWIGKPVEKLESSNIAKLLRKPAMIQIIHKPKKDGKITYANIALSGVGIFKRPDDVPFPKTTENEAFIFELTNFSWEVFNKIPKFIQDKIKKSEEWPSIIAKHGTGTAAITNTGGVVVATDEFEEEEF